MIRSMEHQSEDSCEDIRSKMEAMATKTNIGFMMDFWMSPNAKSYMKMSYIK